MYWLSRAQWARVLKEARRVAADRAARRKHFELEGWSQEDIVEFDHATREYIGERIEVHMGTIRLLRHAGPKKDRLIPAPRKVRTAFEELIGRERTQELLR